MSRRKRLPLFEIVSILTLCVLVGGFVLFLTGNQVNNIFSTTASALGPPGFAGAAPGMRLAPAHAAPTAGTTMDGFNAPAAAAATSTPAAATAPPAYADTAPKAGGAAGSADSPALSTGRSAPSTYQSPLTAGQVDDNAKFPAYLDYLRNYRGPAALPIPVEQRLFVRVLDNGQHPVAGARVQLFDGQRPVFDGRTTSDGRVLFFPQWAAATQAQQLRAVISRGQQQVAATIAASAGEQSVSLPKLDDNSGPVGLDIVFLLDATGSMADEISTIKATVDSVASRIEQLPGSSAPRFGLVAYRDRGDDYITRSWDFGDVGQFSANLAQVQAGGGGDTPESVNAGLHDAIHLPGWTAQDSGRHLRLIFLVGDAAPHLDYANDVEYPALLQDAVAAGIKIFPIGASGLEDQGEYIFRQLAEVTQGQFVFLTYANGVSGAPGPSTDMHVSSGFTVNNLDSLVVRLVAGEIANQTGQQMQSTDPAPLPVVDRVIAGTAVPPNAWQQVGQDILAWATQWSGALWAVLIALGLIWARRRGLARARLAGRPAAPDAVFPLPPVPELPALARMASERRAAAWAAPPAPVAYPIPGRAADATTVLADPGAGHATAPLPGLPAEVARRLG